MCERNWPDRVLLVGSAISVGVAALLWPEGPLGAHGPDESRAKPGTVHSERAFASQGGVAS